MKTEANSPLPVIKMSKDHFLQNLVCSSQFDSRLSVSSSQTTDRKWYLTSTKPIFETNDFFFKYYLDIVDSVKQSNTVLNTE